MDRRGFLGALIAVTSAVASGIQLPTGREIAKATPQAAALSNKVVDILKYCNVTSIASHMDLHRPPSYEVEYVYYPGAKKNETTREIDGYTKGMRPISVEFVEAAGELTRVRVEWM